MQGNKKAMSVMVAVIVVLMVVPVLGANRALIEYMSAPIRFPLAYTRA
jgi:hypothetical protein